MKKLLVICGPTATSKTALALYLAKVFGGELVSADSRQVYTGMDIGTGKDLPKNSRFKISDLIFKNGRIGYYQIYNTKIWGYDLVKPTEEFSVAHYIKIAETIIKDIHKRGKLPILVGGTGLYIKGVIDGIDTAVIKQNIKIRKSLEGITIEDLYKMLVNIDALKAGQLNESDRKNPRRLVRAIEVSSSKNNVGKVNKIEFDVLWLGLYSDKTFLYKKIERRVTERLQNGMLDEIKSLFKFGVNWNSHSMMTLGYRQLRDYLENNISLDEATVKWIKVEQQYAKRQMTWFKKDKRIIWFDITEKDWIKNVENTLKRWHNSKRK